MENPENQGAESEDTETPIEAQESTDSTEVSESSEETSETVESTEKPDSKSEEWLVPGRFKTGADAARAYSELESAFGRRGQELHELKTRASQVTDPEAELQDFANDLKRNPVEAVRKIARKEADIAKQETAKVKFESEYSRLMQNDEFRTLEPVMTQIANQYGDMISNTPLQNDPRLLQFLFYAARGVVKDAENKNAEKRGIQKGEKSALKKSKAQVEGSSGSRGHTTPDIKKMSYAELGAAIKSGKIKP